MLLLSPPRSRAPSSELSALIEKLQKNADKVEKLILETEQNLNKVKNSITQNLIEPFRTS